MGPHSPRSVCILPLKQRGCALIPLRPGVRFSDVTTDVDGRWIAATINTPHSAPMRVCGTYAPNSRQDEFLHRTLSQVAGSCDLVIGDFNFVTRYGDKSPPSPLNNTNISCLDGLNTAGFLDLAPPHSPHNLCHRNRRYTARLDRCYARESPHFSWYISILHRFPTAHNLSDHIPTIIHLISPEPIPRGSPFWRLNQKRLNPNSITTLTYSSAHLAPLPPTSILAKWEVKSIIESCFSTRPAVSRRRTGAEFPGDHSDSLSQCTDHLRAQYEKRLLLGRISADKAKELPSPLLTRVINDQIYRNQSAGESREGNSDLLSASTWQPPPALTFCLKTHLELIADLPRGKSLKSAKFKKSMHLVDDDLHPLFTIGS